MRRILSLMLVAVLMVSCIFPASAAQIDSAVAVETCEPFPNQDIRMPSHMNALNGMQRSTSKPKQYWNLDAGNYGATLTQVGNAYLYTNYYFHPNNDGEIYTRVQASAQGLGQLRVGIYNITENYDAAHWTYEIDATGIDETVRFYNLDTNDHYAVYFSSVYNGYHVVYITGSATVYN